MLHFSRILSLMKYYNFFMVTVITKITLEELIIFFIFPDVFIIYL